MDYLIAKLFWWLIVAFAIGLLIGWLSCSRTEIDKT
jgi:hypothetical protein